MAGSISITEGSRAAFSFWLAAWRPAFGALALAGLLGSAAAVASLVRDFPMMPALYAAYLLAVVMAQGALLRQAGAEGDADGWASSPGWGGFQWGALEWRLLAVALLRTGLFLLLAALLVSVLGVLYVGLATARSGHGVADAAAWRTGAADPLVSAIISDPPAAHLALDPGPRPDHPGFGDPGLLAADPGQRGRPRRPGAVRHPFRRAPPPCRRPGPDNRLRPRVPGLARLCRSDVLSV
jgi:hypothetical protein